jgi:CheY-like chemotaxis protein
MSLYGHDFCTIWGLPPEADHDKIGTKQGIENRKRENKRRVMITRSSGAYTDSTEHLVEDAIRVLVVDSSEAMREGIRHMLNGDETIKVVAEARNGKEALDLVVKVSPDIVILDGSLRGTDSTKVISYIKDSSPSVGIIVLNDEQNFLVPAIENGASGFLSGDVARSDLIGAIRIVHLWRMVLFQQGSNFTLVKL